MTRLFFGGMRWGTSRLSHCCGVRLINESPRIDEHGKRYAFIYPESTGGVLVELYQLS